MLGCKKNRFYVTAFFFLSIGFMAIFEKESDKIGLLIFIASCFCAAPVYIYCSFVKKKHYIHSGFYSAAQLVRGFSMGLIPLLLGIYLTMRLFT